MLSLPLGLGGLRAPSLRENGPQFGVMQEPSAGGGEDGALGLFALLIPRCFVKAGGNALLVPRRRGQASICRGDGSLDPFSVPGLGSRLVPALLWRGVVMEGVCVHPRVPVISSAKLALGRGVRQGHLPAVRIWGL